MNWISVKERLPEHYGSYLVCVGGVVTMFIYEHPEREWRNRNGDIYLDVTHWQPLPDPPGTEKSRPTCPS